MAVFIVTYDLNKEVKRPPIVAEVKKTNWAKLSESSYAISTTETAGGVYQRFKPLLDGNDSFYVISLRHPYSGQGPKIVNDWLDKNLPR